MLKEAIRLEEIVYGNFINQVKEYAIFAMDNQGFITSWNEGAQRSKGYTEAEIVGQYFGILFPNEDQAAGKPQKELIEACKQGQYEAKDWRKRKDGTLFWATITLTPIYAPDGEQLGFTKITGDKTQEKKLEEELAQRQQDVLNRKNEELHKVNLDLDNFIYTASHDLKTPIANIEGLLELLQQELTSKKLQDKAIDNIITYIESSIVRYKTTIRDLTEISRLQKNISEGSLHELLSIPEIYADIMADFGISAKNNPCVIQTSFQVHSLTFSRKNFRSILYNLLSNAIKFRSPDRPCHIQVKSYREDSHFVLSIQDNGLGLTAKNQERLFTMFKRFHSHVEGTGIGLYITKRMIENAGGKIEVQSEEGRGTEFKVYFKEE